MASKTAIEIYRKDLTEMADLFQAALPVTARRYLTPDRLTRVVLTALSRNHKLLQCTRNSILRGVMDLTQCGLELAGPMGHGYLVPFRNKKQGTMEATTIIGYKGYITLASRSGLFAAPPVANVVRDLDPFELDLGAGRPPKHKVDHRKSEAERGNVVGAYCVAKFRAGGYHVEYMSLDQLEAIRAQSRMKDGVTWRDHTVQMQRKSVIRRARNYWPLSADMAQAFDVDANADAAEPMPHVYASEFEGRLAQLPDFTDEDGAGQDKVADITDRVRGS